MLKTNELYQNMNIWIFKRIKSNNLYILTEIWKVAFGNKEQTKERKSETRFYYN